MNKVWILAESGGQYDDYYENHLRAYKTQESANAARELVTAEFEFVKAQSRLAPDRPSLQDFTIPNVPGQLGGNNLDKPAWAAASEKYVVAANKFYAEVAKSISVYPAVDSFVRLFEYGYVDEPNFYVYSLELVD